MSKTPTGGKDTRTPRKNRRSGDGERSSPRPDKSGTGRPDDLQSGHARQVEGQSDAAGARGKPGTAQQRPELTPPADEKRRPESERLRESDGPREHERAEARRHTPARDGFSTDVESDREHELKRHGQEEARLEHERRVRKEDE